MRTIKPIALFSHPGKIPRGQKSLESYAEDVEMTMIWRATTTITKVRHCIDKEREREKDETNTKTRYQNQRQKNKQDQD
jgi:hypothetical protein